MYIHLILDIIIYQMYIHFKKTFSFYLNFIRQQHSKLMYIHSDMCVSTQKSHYFVTYKFGLYIKVALVLLILDYPYILHSILQLVLLSLTWLSCIHTLLQQNYKENFHNESYLNLEIT